MKKLMDILSSLFRSILILWIPILLIEETFLYEYISYYGLFIISIIAAIICLIIYIKKCKKITKINCYLYNIVNTISIAVTNIALGYLFFYFIDKGIFHQCGGTGWDCFLFGIEYIFIGFEYAALSLCILVIWLFIRLIKHIIAKK